VVPWFAAILLDARCAMKFRVLIADRDPAGIRRLLEAESDMEVVGEAADGAEAAPLIAELQPDLLVLDADLPETGGFDLVERLGAEHTPVFLAVASCAGCALPAFEAGAVDYLVKPIRQNRFRMALDRARAHLRQRQRSNLEQRLDALLEELRRPSYVDRLAIRAGQRILVVHTRDIDWIESDANYVRLHVGSKTYVLRESISGMASKLNPCEFVRIRRSYIVNIDRIKELQSFSSREDVVVLQDGTKLMVSRGFRSNVRAALGAA
jgi:two-component system, LytTR family, response regulator